MIELLLLPYDSGWHEARLGRGPGHLVASGVVDALRADGADVRVHTVVSTTSFLTENSAAFELAGALADRVGSAVRQGRTPIVLAGNCSASIGIVAGLGGGPLGVTWFDAHGDLNTPETTRSAFLDGMALAILTGRCWTAAAAGVPGFTAVPDEHALLVGARDLDPAEVALLGAAPIASIAPDDVRAGRLDAALAALRRRVHRVYLHVDMDVLDPAEGRANQFAAPAGLRLAELLESIDRIGAHFEIAGAAITAYDPSFDPDGRVARAAIETVQRIAATTTR